jgi:hypothetical protein
VSEARPTDVDTGFWLWLAAVPIMLCGYLVDLVTTQQPRPAPIVLAMSGLFMFALSAVVVTFLFLMRQGYRWARTLLTGGGLISMLYAGTSLFATERPPTPAVAFAVTAIVGSVLIAGGVFLLHRKDVHGYFVR